MKNRREFLKIFGMLTAAGAVFTTVGAVSPKSALVGKELNHDEFMKVMMPVNARDRVTCPTVRKDVYDLDVKWLEGDYDEWRKVWAGMSQNPVRIVHHDLDAQEKLHNITFSDSWRQNAVDNVFKNSPLFEYLKNKDTMVLNPDTIISTGDIDISTFGPVTTSGNTADGTPPHTTGTSEVEAGAYGQHWETFKENE